MRRSKKGQSMVEYALGLGCVAAVCMVAMSFLGHVSGDIFYNVQKAVNYGGSAGDHGVGNPGHLVTKGQQPWALD